jgi:hypothetical protein
MASLKEISQVSQAKPNLPSQMLLALLLPVCLWTFLGNALLGLDSACAQQASTTLAPVPPLKPARSRKEGPSFGFYPLKICPSLYENHWNVYAVKKRKKFHGRCHAHMFKPLNEYIPDRTTCSLFSSAIVCSDNQGGYLKICLGHAGVGQWSVRYRTDRPCRIKPYTAISKLVPKKLFTCQVWNQSIMCLPKNFDPNIVFAGGKVKIVNVDCPKGAKGFGNIDRVYCEYQAPTKKCEPPKFIGTYKGKKVCKEIRSYFVHIWQLDSDFELYRAKVRRTQLINQYNMGY